MRFLLFLSALLLLLAACDQQPLPTPPPGTPAAAVDFEDADSFPRRNYVSHLAFAPDGALWAGVADGVIRWNLDDLTYYFYGARDGLGGEGVRALDVDARGRLVVASATGVHRFDGAAWSALPAMAPDVAARRLVVHDDGTIWAGSEKGLWRFESDGWSKVDAGEVGNMALRGDLLWYRRGDVLIRLDTRTGRSHTVEGPGGTVGTLLGIDAAGAPWMALDYDAVYRWDGNTWQTAFAGADLVCSAAFAADGTPYMGTCGGFHAYGHGAQVRENGTWRSIGEPPDPDIIGLALAADGTLAIGTSEGIQVGSDGAWRTLQVGPLHPITSMIVAPDGSLFVAYGNFSTRTDAVGVSRLDHDGWTHWEDLGNVTELALGPDGTVWTAGQCTLSSFREGAWTAHTRDCDDIFGPVMGLAFTGGGELWLGTPYRLVRYARSAFLQEDLLVSDMVADGQGNIWIRVWTGRQGEYLLRQYAGGELVRERPLEPGQFGPLLADSGGQAWLFSPQAGLWPLGADRGDPLPLPFDGAAVTATAAGPDGALWFATDQALIRFHEEQWQFVAVDPGWTGPAALAVAPDGTLWRGDWRGVERRPTADR